MHQDRGQQEARSRKRRPSRPAGRAGGRRHVRAPGARAGPAVPRGRGASRTTFGDAANEIRIACIDIGGGTTDLMIARYNFESKIDDSIRGQVLHQDGISLGGDQLVKRLLETIIVPAFAEALGLEDEDVQLLFGPEVPRNREYPRAAGQLDEPAVRAAGPGLSEQRRATTCTTSRSRTPIPRSSIRRWSSRCRRSFDKLRGPGYYNVQQELDLVFDHRPSSRAWSTTCSTSCCSTTASGSSSTRPTWCCWPGCRRSSATSSSWCRCTCRCRPSRIVPMHNHYAGNWYPYQDEKGHNPGVIIDPKSPVVVGAAIEFMARHGMLPQFKFEMKGTHLREHATTGA